MPAARHLRMGESHTAEAQIHRKLGVALHTVRRMLDRLPCSGNPEVSCQPRRMPGCRNPGHAPAGAKADPHLTFDPTTSWGPGTPIRRTCVTNPSISPQLTSDWTSLAMVADCAWRNRQWQNMVSGALPPLARRRVRRGPVREFSMSSVECTNSAPSDRDLAAQRIDQMRERPFRAMMRAARRCQPSVIAGRSDMTRHLHRASRVASPRGQSGQC